YKTMSKGQKRIASYIMENFDSAAFLTAGKLGVKVGVSESTVVRFANSLGYSGYPELQKELQEMLRSRLTGTQRMELTGRLPNTKLFEKVLKTDVDNLRLTLNEIDKVAFEEAVKTIINAKRVYVMGVRSAHTVAYILGYYLDFILDNVRTVTDASTDNIEQLIHIGADDVFIGISFPRYSKRTVDAMSYAKAHGAKCIGITDSAFSPLSEYSHIKMEVHCNTVSFVDSLVAPLSVVNALLAAISQEKKEELSVHLAEMELLRSKNNFYARKK
ncbi:MAG: MurR/RpiR family transcriptional regulator, partial [Clostridia bacterium]|nr:MurR/RpiR family transcriptional regulator [Clostridia bacterium]